MIISIPIASMPNMEEEEKVPIQKQSSTPIKRSQISAFEKVNGILNVSNGVLKPAFSSEIKQTLIEEAVPKNTLQL